MEEFWLPVWIKSRNWWQNIRMAYEVQKLLGSDLKTDIQARLPLDKVKEAITLYKEKRTEGKVLLIP